jgi:phenylacetate-CoA ligase
LIPQLTYCYERIPFYRRLWDSEGFLPAKVKTWSDFTRYCPVVRKHMLVADQAEHPPFGSYLGVEPSEVFRIHGSSGTSGTPTLYGVSKSDWKRAAETFAMTQWAMGVRPDDTVHITFPFSLFFAGWGVLAGAERTGATCLPIGFNDSARHVELLYKAGSTVVEATPSHLLHLAEVAKGLGYDPPNSPVRRAIVGGEPGGSIPSTRQRLLETWGLETVCDSGSSSEMYPFCTSSECTEMTGPHLWTDEVWTELVDEEDYGTPAGEDDCGALVYTHLWRQSQPMIRFAPGDAAYMTAEPCACGRTYPRLPLGVVGRLDDMLLVRGVNVYPAAIERGLREVPCLGLEFRILVDRSAPMTEVSVEVEHAEGVGPDPVKRARLEKLAEELVQRYCHVRVPVRVVAENTFERTTLKAKRVLDAATR